MRWICYVGISVILSLELQAQSLIEQLDSGSQQWLMETFEESYPPVSHAGECPEAWKYAGDLPELVQLKDRNCGAWRNSKAMCDLLFPLVQRKLESQNMSEDYVYLALALSGLDMHRSYKGRAGIWQLTFPVALAHGLDVEDTADQRYAPDISTDAALAYLAELEYRFHDKPHLAVLAFVHSVPYVHGLSDQQALEEAAEWQEKLAALKAWYEGTKRGAYLLDLIGVLNTHENVVFEQDISYEVLHDALGVSEAYLRGGNPVFRAETIPANYRAMPFLLTADAAGRMEELGDSLYAWEAKLAAEREAKRIAAAEARKPPAGSARTYTVRSGDVLGSIAQRNGVRVSEIKRWNGPQIRSH